MEKKVCLVGKSGSGKTTICEKLRSKGYQPLDSYTTRPKRTDDEIGHVFVDQEGFDAIRHDLVAYTKFDEYEYGATRNQFEECDIYVLDPKGVEELVEKVGRDRLYIVYLTALEAKRFTRMVETRGQKSAFQRVKHDEKAFDGFVDFDFALENNYSADLSYNVRMIELIIKRKRMNSSG